MKIHLVDGTFELFRCFNGAARAFAHTMVALLRRKDVTHVAVAFATIVDAPIAAASDDGPWSQHSTAAEIIRALGIVLWPMIRRYEADDAMASAATRFAAEPDVDQVVICTRDKDLAQCVIGDRVVLLDRVNDIVLDEAGVVARWGVAPHLIPSLLALVGDKADGLPGLPGWGKASSAAVLNRYGGIEAIPADPAAWDVAVRGEARLAAILDERRKRGTALQGSHRTGDRRPAPRDDRGPRMAGADRDRLGSVVARIGAVDVLDRVPRWRT